MGNDEASADVLIFENPEFGSIRTITEDGKTLFCATDIAGALGYSNLRDAIRRHCKGVVKRDSLTQGGMQSLSYIYEGDVYRLIIHSKLPAAERFEAWVFDEVLPTIRRHGAYMTDSLLEKVARDPDLILELAAKLLEEQQMRVALEYQLQTVRPKADYFDTFVNPNGCTSIRNTAKELEIPEREFISYLLDHHYLYRDKQKRLLPYSVYTKKEYFYVRDVYTPGGELTHQTLFTCRGKNHFRRLMAGKEVK